MDVNKNLSKFLDIDAKQEIEKISLQPEGSTAAASEDYTYTRQNLKKLLDTGTLGLEGILKVATESDSPRAYEVLANTLKTLAEINVSLMDVSAKHAQATKSTIQNQTNNSIFVGTTKDLQSLLKKGTKPLESDIIDVGENRLPNKPKS